MEEVRLLNVSKNESPHRCSLNVLRCAPRLTPPGLWGVRSDARAHEERREARENHQQRPRRPQENPGVRNRCGAHRRLAPLPFPPPLDCARRSATQCGARRHSLVMAVLLFSPRRILNSRTFELTELTKQARVAPRPGAATTLSSDHQSHSRSASLSHSSPAKH